MFIDRNGQISITEIGAITAQIYDTSDLNLEDAARVASARDEAAANSFLHSWFENSTPEIHGAVLSIQ
jgi:hypothetical protein